MIPGRLSRMLEVGQTLSHYRVAEKIGEGGMGEVWRATDLRLSRDVALKFLPAAVTHDQERLDRFTREARTLASLNHPGIATIYDVDEHDGVRFIVMEMVPGDDLAQALDRGPLPLAEALVVALQIARAVETAHGQGVVHRDLKPANVKRVPDGQIKVLDFGLAKAMSPDPSSDEQNISMSPTMTSAGTIAGVILGTAAYMSPEQARGKLVDKRTDIWSFGVVLYELLTGDNPFRGDTVADSVGAILHRDPDLGALPADAPASLRRLLRRCLARDRSHRLHDIADARIELEEMIARPDADESVAPAQPAARRSKLSWLALAVLVPLAAAVAWWIGSRQEPPAAQPVREFKLVHDQEVDEVHLTRDGSRLAYRIENTLFVRSLDSLDARVVSDDGQARTVSVFWSPGGQSVGLIKQGGEFQRIDLDSGSATVLASLDSIVGHPFWSDDGYIYFAEFESGIHRMPESGGASEQVLEPHQDMLDYHGLIVLPGGRGFLTIPHLQVGEYRKIFLEKPGEEPRVLFECDSLINGLRYSETGHLFYQRDENPRGLWALPFSLELLDVTGSPFLVVPGLEIASFSGRGDMAYAQASVESGKQKQQIVWADRTGAIVERLDMPLYGAMQPVTSPDRSRLAVVAKGIGRPSTGKSNLWVIDLERGTSMKLTEDGVLPAVVTWDADGSRIAFLQEPEKPGGNKKLVSIRSDGTGDRETLLEADISFYVTLTRDWSLVAFMTGSLGDESGIGIAVQAPGDPSSLRTLIDGPNQDVLPVIHPDGDWIAYMSGVFPNMDTFVQPFPEGEGRWKISIETGGPPFWSADGRRLYYVRQDEGGTTSRVMEVEFDITGARPSLGTPIELFSTDALTRGIEMDPDGRFIYVVDEEIPEGEDRPDTYGIVFVENWLTRFAE